MICVMIVDDYVVMCDGVCYILECVGDFEVVCEVFDGMQVL